MNRTILSLASLGTGAALMYWLDPLHGRRRRADARNQAVRMATRGTRALDVATRDLENRFHGLVSEAKSMLTSDRATDEVVAQRARSRLGRVSSYPALIETSCKDGHLILEGQVLDREKQDVHAAMSRVRGVKSVESWLESFDHVPQGIEPRRRGMVAQRPGLLTQRRNWTPATRLVAGGAGAGLCLFGLQRGGIFGNVALFGGGFLCMRALTNMNVRQMVGVGARPGIRLAKTIEVHAPPDEVFSFLSAPEHFPRFMSNVREVRKLNGQYHWKVAGPAGTSFEWDANITRMEPNRELAWRTEPGSVVEHAGVIQCEPNRAGGTRVTIRMSYNPPAGRVGHAFAKLFGADPKSQMDEDLVRFKSLIEQGKATTHGHTVHREEISPPLH